MHVQPLVDIDPFDLPDWLGTAQVVWHADGGLRDGHLVAGRLTADGHDDLVCDLLGVDDAYPVPVTDDASRLRAHQAWRHGQVLLGQYDGRHDAGGPRHPLRRRARPRRPGPAGEGGRGLARPLRSAAADRPGQVPRVPVRHCP